MLRVGLLLVLLGGAIYGVKNYRRISHDNGYKSRVLGEWTNPPDRLVNPVLKKVNGEVEQLSGTKIEIPEAGSSGDNKELITKYVEKEADQLVKTMKKLPDKQAARIKEQIIQEVFPSCECSCSIIKGNND